MANGKSGIEEDLATHLQPSVQMATLELIINEEPLQKQNLQKCCQCNAMSKGGVRGCRPPPVSIFYDPPPLKFKSTPPP